jgi:hypothetical protein
MRCSGRPLRWARSQPPTSRRGFLLGVKIDQCPHSAEGDMRALNEGSGFPQPVIRSIHSTCLLALVTDRAMEAWYHPSIAGMTPNRRVTWQATSDDENS